MDKLIRIAVLVSILLFVFGTALADDLSDHPFLGEVAPDFDLEEVDGGSLKLSDLRGQYVVIHFGASW